MSSYTLSFIKYLVGLRDAETTYTNAELQFVGTLAIGKKCIVEVGVREGVESKVFCQNMDNGKLYLIDPYLCQVKLENLLNISFTEFIAKQHLRDYVNLIQFVKMPSKAAAKYLNLKGKVDLIFIDLKHDYESVFDNFSYWFPMLSPKGIIVFPYSRLCQERPGLNSNSGAIRLCDEIARGQYGEWQVVDTFEWITVISSSSNSSYEKLEKFSSSSLF